MSYWCSKLSISIGTIGYITIKAYSVGLGSRIYKGSITRALKVIYYEALTPLKSFMKHPHPRSGPKVLRVFRRAKVKVSIF